MLSARDRLRAFFEQNVGKIIHTSELREVSGIIKRGIQPANRLFSLQPGPIRPLHATGQKVDKSLGIRKKSAEDSTKRCLQFLKRKFDQS